MGWKALMSHTEKILEPLRAFTILEAHVRAQVGLGKDELRPIRNGRLKEGEHWSTVGRNIAYSPEGLAELQRVLKISPAEKDAGPAHGSNAQRGEPVKPEVITLRVFRTGLKNARVIEAYYPTHDPADPGNRVTVRVRHAKNFTRGMEIPVIKLRDGLYELARACPRTKGKW